MDEKKRDRNGITSRAEKELRDINMPLVSVFKENTANEIESVENEAREIVAKLFPETWDSDFERWSNAFRGVYKYLGDLYKKDPEIQNSPFVKEHFKRNEVWNYDVLVSMLGGGSVGTFRNWSTEKSKPRSNKREDVIHLGFLAKYNEEEMNYLLRSAELPLLYAKGIRANKGGEININDHVYTCMISSNYPFGTRSFDVAQKCIEEATQIIQTAVKICVDEKKPLTTDVDTLAIRKHIKESIFSEDEEKWINEVLNYVNTNIRAFAFSYVRFMSDIVTVFKTNYNISKGGKKESCLLEGYNVEYDKDTLSINKFTEGWNGYLAEVFATAFNTKEGILKKKMYIPDREDIIVLSLLICGDRKQTDSYLRKCSFEKLYPASKVEGIIIYALDKRRTLSPDYVIKMLCEHSSDKTAEKLKTSYLKFKKDITSNIMFRSLQLFGWIELVWEYTDVYDYKETKKIIETYPKNWLIKNLTTDILKNY